MRVMRLDERIGKIEFPNPGKIDTPPVLEGDILVVCAGFEDRTVGVLENVVRNNVSNIEVIVIEYLPEIKENRLGYILSTCSKQNYKIKNILYDREHPEGVGTNVLNTIENKHNNIWIDISGMSRFLIVQLFEAFSSNEKLNKVRLLYQEAEVYPPDEKSVQKSVSNEEDCQNIGMFLSSGVFEVCVVPELSSVALQGQPIRLIVFPSFNSNQLMALRAVIQPSYISIINGIPPDEKNIWRTEAIRELNCLQRLQNKDEYNTSTLEYRDTVSTLLDIYNKYAELERLVIAPIGSKMQTVAVGLLRTYLDDIQIVYPTPRSFIQQNEYTKGIGPLYMIDFSNLPSSSNL